uniref:Uncharacterized protein n=1 Tax=Anguilla anguilla TaxID=7936 RepID=A0A0E9SPI9_ANGAN
MVTRIYSLQQSNIGILSAA